jgi:cytochrome b subunit of formate dehydrogenase
MVNCYKRILLLCLAILLMAGAAQAKDKKAATPKLGNADCLACHSDPSMTKDVNGKQVSLAVDEKKFTGSIHGSMFTCVDCHADVREVPHSNTPAKPTCATCHADQQKAYDSGFHAKAIKAGDQAAARCTDCHGSIHEILPSSDPNSRTSHTNIPKTCAVCHDDAAKMGNAGLTAQPAVSYPESVHGLAVAGGSQKAAVCSDCHGSHDIRAAGDSQSSIFKANVPQTCAKCHETQKSEFMASIHGQAIARGNMHAPACTDCHGIHTIKRHTDPNSSVAGANLARITCAQCHESVKLSAEFGVPGRRTSTYMASYHGMATQMGSAVAANCASCHGVHNILPSSDPKSTINSANLMKTCGQCHPGANENFAKGKVHVDSPQAADIGSKAVRFVRKFYLMMIFATIGGMLVHNLLIVRKKLAFRREGHAHVGGGPRVVVRMNKRQRIQHLLLLSSFFMLVFTGFALKYPTSWLAWVFINETVRSWIHRGAGVVLIGASLYHVYYIASCKEGRKLFMDMLPTWKDAIDLRDFMLYYVFGRDDNRPQFGRFGYAEKMEYLALVWGTIVMAVTGLMLWFKVYVGNLVPRWFIDVATTVHFYEAILATLSIIVWHFYQVIFDPDVYPINWAWYDGKVSLEHYREEHPLDFETLATVKFDEQEDDSSEEKPEEETAHK